MHDLQNARGEHLQITGLIEGFLEREIRYMVGIQNSAARPKPSVLLNQSLSVISTSE